MVLDRGSEVALWRQILDTVRNDIESGRYEAGQRLPTEHEFSRYFGVNRHTVRRALSMLESKGFIRVEHGRGSFVREDMVGYSLGRRVRFSENIGRQNRAPLGELEATRTEPAGMDVARALTLRPGTEVECLETVYRADDRVICLSTLYFPSERFRGIAELYRETHSISDACRHFGVEDFIRRTTRITARMPSSREAEALGQPRTRPVIVTESINTDTLGIPIEYGITRWASERVQFLVGSED